MKEAAAATAARRKSIVLKIIIPPRSAASKPPSPVKAIRARCLDCSDTRTDVRECWADDCPLYPFRMGHRPPGSSPLAAIRGYCLWCCDGSADEVAQCHPLDCVLRRFRFGSNPARAGQGSIANVKAGKRELTGVSAAGNGKKVSGAVPPVL